MDGPKRSIEKDNMGEEKENPMERFKSLARRIILVPKEEVNEKQKKDN